MSLLPRNSLTHRHRTFLLKLLQTAQKNSNVSTLLKKATPTQINALSEIALNLLQRNFPVRANDIKKLYPYRGLVRQLASRKTPPTRKKKLLLRKVQTGGILPFLIPFLAPIAGTLAAAGIERLL